MAQRTGLSFQIAEQTHASGKTKNETSHDKVHHTVTACVRCRQRKTRCDPGLPRCEPCERNNARCEYFDSTKGRTISRTYITSLQANVRKLQTELATMEKQVVHEPDPEAMMRSAGLIKFGENDESRFLGPSSGIAITRLVMELAKQNTANKSIKEVVSDTTQQEIKQKFDDESAKPTSKVYPLISSVAAPNLPTHDLLERLVEIYMAKAQYMLPLLHEPSFREDVRAVYRGSTDATINFQLRLVIAISMQRLDTQYAGLADSYYLAALPYLEAAVRKKDLSTLQCFALIAQYSLLTPTRTASYWVVGLGTRLCQELGITEERTIKEYNGVRFNTLEVDMRRRLFWIITSMEYGLAHSLGRPSAFGITVDHIDVQFFELCDDRFITPSGLLPGNHPIMKKCIAIHFFKMRLLQAEIRRMLYLKKRDTPLNDQDPWFTYMQNKIDNWVSNCPKNDEGSGFSEIWFHARRNTFIVFLYRPSPQIPRPSPKAAERCYEAATFNVEVQKHQLDKGLVDLTWIFTQQLFMALNTILWSLSYPNIRQQHPPDEVRRHVTECLRAIDMTADRWPGVQSARQLYDNLIEGCFRAYDNDKPYTSSVHGQSPASVSTYEAAPSPSQGLSYSPSSTNTASITAPTSPSSYADSYAAFAHTDASPASKVDTNSDRPPQNPTVQTLNIAADSFSHPQTTQPQLQQSPSYAQTQTTQPPLQYSQSYSQSLIAQQPPEQSGSYSFQPNGQPTHPNVQPIYGLPDFEVNFGNLTDPLSMTTSQHWQPNTTMAPVNPGQYDQLDVEMDYRPWLGSFGDEYSRYTQQMYFPSSQQMQPLSEQQQSELLATLEQDQLPDVNVSKLVSESATFYKAQLM